MAELAFVASPVSTHVQTAEMGNQALNSLALVSARYTHTAVDLVCMMCSAHLYALCQALDLRAMHLKFLEKLELVLEELCTNWLSVILDRSQQMTVKTQSWPVILKTLMDTRTEDSSVRFATVAKAASAVLLDMLMSLTDEELHGHQLINIIKIWTEFIAARSLKLFEVNRDEYLANPDATPFLGMASKKMYTFVRKDLKVPMHKGIVDHPSVAAAAAVGANGTAGTPHEEAKSIGSHVSTIHHALRTGYLMVPVMECVEEALDDIAEVNGKAHS